MSDRWTAEELEQVKQRAAARAKQFGVGTDARVLERLAAGAKREDALRAKLATIRTQGAALVAELFDDAEDDNIQADDLVIQGEYEAANIARGEAKKALAVAKRLDAILSESQ